MLANIRVERRIVFFCIPMKRHTKTKHRARYSIFVNVQTKYVSFQSRTLYPVPRRVYVDCSLLCICAPFFANAHLLTYGMLWYLNELAIQ